MKSFGRLLDEQRGNQSVVGVAAAQFNLSPANPRKLYVVWQRLSTVLLHILGWDKELQSLPFPESLELKSVPGVCHKEMTAVFSDPEGNQQQQSDAPGHLRWGLRQEPLVSLPGSSFHWEMKHRPRPSAGQ